MEINERFERIARATPDILSKIDDILEGRDRQPEKSDLSSDCKLLSIAESCRVLGLKYPTFHRAMQAGCFDTVTATGRTMIKESSLREYAAGLRKPSSKYLAARAEKNRLRRLSRAASVAKVN